jgi:prophage regulatory protein
MPTKRKKKLRRNISRERVSKLVATANKARTTELPKFPDTTTAEGKPRKRLISRRQTCDRVHLTYPTIWKRVKEGTFPRPRAVGGKTMFVEDEIDQWIDALPFREYDTEAA